jgi:hypothetical protein
MMSWSRRMRPGRRIWSVAGSGVALMLAITAAWGQQQPVEGVQQVFFDDFERDERGPDWTAQYGRWTILDAALYTVGPAVITCNKTLPRNVRVEYDCYSREPCDMSLLLCKGPGSNHTDGYFFGFGSEGNARNKVIRLRQEIAADTEHLPVPKQWHHVIVQKRGRFLEMWVDGEKSLSAYDFKEEEMSQRHWGFYVWTQAKFDNVRAVELPEEAGEEPPEVQPTVNEFFPFSDDEQGAAPAGLDTISGERCTVQVISFPNVIPGRDPTGPATAQDGCLALSSGGWGSTHLAGIRDHFEPIESGLVELDVMAPEEQSNGGTVQLLDEDRKVLATFGWDDQGHYYNYGPEGRMPLDCRVEFPHRSTQTLIRQQPGRWLTLRLEFDAEAGEYDAALLGYYTVRGDEAPGRDPDRMCNRMVLGSDLPFRELGRVAGVAIMTDAQARLLLDNLVVYGPVSAYTVNGKDRRLAAAELLDLGYGKRRDPFRLKVFSTRHLLTMKGVKPEEWPTTEHVTRKGTEAYKPFKEAGVEYSRLLVREARAQEALRTLRRAIYYLGAAGEPEAAVAQASEKAEEASAGAAAALERAYQAYAEAYADRLNAEKLREEYGPAQAGLTAALEKLEGANAALGGLVYAHSAEVAGLGRCAAGGDLREAVWREGHYELAGMPAHMHSQRVGPFWQVHTGLEQVLELPCMMEAWRNTNDCEEGELGNYEHFGIWFGSYAESRPYATFAMMTSFGPHDIWMAIPQWWVEQKVKEDPDILFRDREGKPLGVPEGEVFADLESHQGPHAFLNYWNPSVQRLMADTGREYGEFLAREYPGRTKSICIGGEQKQSIYGKETGFNPSAVAAFRQFLKEQYGNDIGRLNEAWGTEHTGFDEIGPPPEGGTEPSGIAYEFQRFRQEGYMDWVRAIGSGFREALGGVPLVSYYNITFGGIDRSYGFDMVPFFKTYDVNCYHTFHRQHWFPMSRCLDSLSKAYPGHALGRMEWAGSTTAPDMSDERCYLANGLSLQFCDMAWGMTFHSLWYGTMCGWSMGANWTDYRLGNAALRYSASYVPLSIERCRALGRPALEHPTIPPDVGLLEVTSSFYNGYPDSLYWLGVRRALTTVAVRLEELGINYGFLYEEPVLEGRQELTGCQAIVVPVGMCCPPRLREMLLDYVRDGGTLVLLGPCGIYDQYGKPDNQLMETAFPGVEWQRSGIGWAATGDTAKSLRPEAIYGQSGQMLRKRIGLGTLFLFTELKELDTELLGELIQRSVRRSYDRSDRENIQMVVREAPEGWYVYVVNMDWQETREAQVMLAMEADGVYDMGCEKPMRVPHRSAGGSTRFWVRLAPAEGTVLRVSRR